MKLIEKVSYLQGLMDGLEIDSNTKDGKVLKQMADILTELIKAVGDLRTDIDEISELCDNIDEDLGAIESDFYECDCDCEDDPKCECSCCAGEDSDEDEDDDSEDDDEFDDDELYEVTCPTCNDTICIGEEILLDGSMECPNCGEMLEFDLGDDDFLAEEEGK